jgi:methylated-DNA-[protein]-cysteine S-methyltransferase
MPTTRAALTEFFIDRLDSPIGVLHLVSDGRRLCALDYDGYDERLRRLLTLRYGPHRLREAADSGGATSALRRYLAGDLGAVDALEVDTGGTPFQRAVWAALRAIPCGTTTTYGELARRVGEPSAARAVGITNSLNPIAIVVPCHRVIGADDSLTGYAGGLHRKQWLLEHEGAQLPLFH